MFNLREYREPEAKLANYLPWALLVAPGVVEQKDGLLQKTVEFRGPDLSSTTRNGLISVVARINNALKRLGAGWSLFIEAQRSQCTLYPASDWPDPISKLLDDERRRAFEGNNAHFSSRYYLTFVYAPPSQKQQQLWSLFFKDASSEKTNGRDTLDYFLKTVEGIVSLVRSLVPMVKELDNEETLTYLHSTISTKRHKVVVPEVPMYLDILLPDQELHCGLECKLGDSFLKTITIRSFPGLTFPGILGALDSLLFEYRWMTRYLIFGKDQARSELNKYKKRWYSKRKSISTVLSEQATQSESAMVDNDALNKALDADSALQELDGDLVSYGQFTATVTVWGATRAIAEQKISAVEQAINSMGFTAHRETLNSTQAWLGSLPGHVYANVRRPLINSINLAHLMPLSATWVGQERNEHLNAACHLVAKTKANTPFFLSTAVGDVGHTLILGPTGAGKSTLLSILALQWLRYKDAQVFIFDKGKSARAATLAVGGQHYALGGEDSELCFQPLRNVDNENERAWAIEWLGEIMEQSSFPVTPSLKKELWSSLNSLASMPSEERTLSSLVNMLQNRSLREIIEPFTLKGAFGQLLDASTDTFSTGNFQCFEMEALMETKSVVLPVLSYLFHALEKRFNGAPTLLILDEAWLFLDHPSFQRKIREWLKVLRKANVYVIFATQSLADAMSSNISSVILESCLTKIFLPNATAKDAESRRFYEAIGLNERQIQIISEAVPKREYYYSSQLGNRLFELGLGPIGMALCASSSKEDQRLMDAILSEHGLDNFGRGFLKNKQVIV